jgi:hypothetical protein
MRYTRRGASNQFDKLEPETAATGRGHRIRFREERMVLRRDTRYRWLVAWSGERWFVPYARNRWVAAADTLVHGGRYPAAM